MTHVIGAGLPSGDLTLGDLVSILSLKTPSLRGSPVWMLTFEQAKQIADLLSEEHYLGSIHPAHVLLSMETEAGFEFMGMSLRTTPPLASWHGFGERAAADDTTRDPVGPSDVIHKRANEVIDDVLAGRVVPPVRQAIRRALDTADAPLTGRKASDEGLSRAIRLRLD
jgi:hypothetical protein